jgi:hypothetical protein
VSVRALVPVLALPDFAPGFDSVVAAPVRAVPEPVPVLAPVLAAAAVVVAVPAVVAPAPEPATNAADADANAAAAPSHSEPQHTLTRPSPAPRHTACPVVFAAVGSVGDVRVGADDALDVRGMVLRWDSEERTDGRRSVVR